jgi:hypothetical protein
MACFAVTKYQDLFLPRIFPYLISPKVLFRIKSDIFLVYSDKPLQVLLDILKAIPAFFYFKRGIDFKFNIGPIGPDRKNRNNSRAVS